MKIKKKKILKYLAGFIIVASLGSYFYFQQTNGDGYEFVQAKAKSLTEVVEVSGKVTPVDEVDLAFEISGKVTSISADVGDIVTEGQKLIELNNQDLRARLSQAQARVAIAQAGLAQYEAALEKEQVTLQEYKRGTRQEEIDLAQTEVENAKNLLESEKENLTETKEVAETKKENAENELEDAKTTLKIVKEKAITDLDNLYKEVEDIMVEAYNVSDSAVHQLTDRAFQASNPTFVQLAFLTTEESAEQKGEKQRQEIERTLSVFKEELELVKNFEEEKTQFDELLQKSKEYLNETNDLMSTIKIATDGAINLSETEESTLKANVTTARTNINSALTKITAQINAISSQKITNANAITDAQTKVNNAENNVNVTSAENRKNIQSAETDVQTAKNNLAKAYDELALKEAGSTEEEIAAQEAKVKEAEANLKSQKARVQESVADTANARAEFNKSMMYSPINGVVTALEIQKGEIVGANETVISVISKSKFENEINIPEVSISKIKVGDNANITLDAYGDERVFKGKVAEIEPAETLIDDIPTYKVILAFSEVYEEIKSGMTSNTEVITATKENVVSVPSSALIYKDGKTFVKIHSPLHGSAEEEKSQKPELKEIEVTTGIIDQEGDIEITSGLEENEWVLLP